MTSDINIVNGPSKFDLMTALFIWQPQRPEVEFTAMRSFRRLSMPWSQRTAPARTGSFAALQRMVIAAIVV